MLRTVSIIVARQLHAIFVARPIAAFRPSPPCLRGPRSTRRRERLLAPTISRIFFSFFFFRQRAQIFPPFLPEPQNDAKIRYRFAEAGLAADRATDLPRSKPSSSSSSPPASMKKYLIFRLFFFPSLFPLIRFPNGGKILKILNDLSSRLAIEKTDRV